MDRDLFQRNEDLATLRVLDVQRDRVNLLNRQLDEAGFPAPHLDQYPAKRRPVVYNRIIGPVGMQKAGKLDGAATGFLSLAPLADTATYVAPENPITIGREKLFFCTHIQVACFVSWTYTAATNDDSANPMPFTSKPAGGLFDSVFDANGGACMLMNHSGTAFDSNAAGLTNIAPKAYFELELYDKKRGRSLTDGQIPGELVLGGAFENKALGGFSPNVTNRGYRFDVDTQIEPRLYLKEVRMAAYNMGLTTNTQYQNASVAVWFQVMMMGYNQFAIAPDSAWHTPGPSNAGFNAPSRRF